MAAVMRGLRRWWERMQRVDGRRLQLEMDTHRLCFLTNYYKAGNGEKTAEEISQLVSRASFEEQQRQVQKNVHEQVCHIARVMNQILGVETLQERDNSEEKKRVRPSGLSLALGEDPAMKLKQQNLQVQTRDLNRGEVSAALQQHLGYTLALQASQIDHKEAGLGVFLVGKASPGTVVCLYPGVIYAPSQYRYVPGYPKVDKYNPYFISRYDGIVIDGKPWGSGGATREFWDGSYSSNLDTNLQESAETRLWQLLGGNVANDGARKGAILERRNPLALAHYVNHPINGLQPNVMICAYDFLSTDTNLRPYIPNVPFDDDDQAMRRRGLLWVRAERDEEGNIEKIPMIRTILLVTTTEVCNEELFLNYRLSNSKYWPDWYQPVDRDEDMRRWE